jgi:5-methylcytosine-specific restriction endonuclease McrA
LWLKVPVQGLVVKWLAGWVVSPKSDHEPVCALCGQERSLTFHHLIPRKLHRRTAFKKSYSKEELNQGIHICVLCHRGIHRLYDEMALGKRLNTLAALLSDEAIQRHIQWVAKQKRR